MTPADALLALAGVLRELLLLRFLPSHLANAEIARSFRAAGFLPAPRTAHPIWVWPATPRRA